MAEPGKRSVLNTPNEECSNDSAEIHDSDLEVATVLAHGFVSQGLNKSRSTQPSSRQSNSNQQSPYRAPTVLTNVQRGNTAAQTPANFTLHSMAAQGELMLLQQMFDMCACLNQRDSYGYSPVMWACMYNQWDTVKYFIEKGADLNIQGTTGETALILACIAGHQRIVLQLLEAGADTDLQCSKGNTALTYAVHGNHVHCVDLLLKAGADFMLVNQKGFHPLQLAIASNNTQIQKLIEKHMVGLLTGGVG